MSIFERLRRERKEEAPLIHQDFKIRGDVYDRERDLRWRWNWVHIKDSPKRKTYSRVIKLAFPFDDPERRSPATRMRDLARPRKGPV